MTAAQPLIPKRQQAVQPGRKHAGDGEAGDEIIKKNTKPIHCQPETPRPHNNHASEGRSP